MSTRKSLSEKEVWEILNSFEKETGIVDLTLNDTSVWQILRFSVAMDLHNYKWQQSESSSKKIIIISFLKGLAFWKLPLRKRFIVQTFYSGLRFRGSDGYEDIWFDELLKNSDEGGKLIRNNAPGFQKRLEASCIPADYDDTFVYYLSALMEKISPLKDTSNICRKISELMNSRLKCSWTEKKVGKKLGVFFWQVRIYQILLRISGTKNVLVVDTGEFPLMQAARKEKIRFVELQHGIFSKFHPCSWSREYAHHPYLLFPDFLGVYGDFWAKELEDTAIASRNSLKILGNAFIDRYKKRKVVQTGPLRVVVTTQPFDLWELDAFIQRFVKIVKREIEVVIKLHPATDMTRMFELFKDKRIKVLSAFDEPNTYELINSSHFHVSVSSACHYDALSIGTPTIVLALESHEQVMNLVDAGFARIARTPEELESLVEQYSADPKSFEITDPEYFCRSGFVQNTQSILI